MPDVSPVSSRRIMIARILLGLLTATTTGLMVWWFAGLVTADGFTLLDWVTTPLFAVLILWISFSFWVATLGLAADVLRRGKRDDAVVSPDCSELPRTAVLVPIYNEDPVDVFAGVQAMIGDMTERSSASLFDVFVLSDTTDPEIWLAEERTWARVVAESTSDARIFYRHRARNVSRKAGNIADFCCRWGANYPYMIVMDADSVMSAETLLEMLRRMEADPRIGILQVPPRPVNRNSLFARMQQFAARLYSPIFLEGFALWAHCDGNYWGHNAIIRIEPFMEHCDLPLLPGNGPLGGEILSHDFVEAALMRRAGWKVCLAHDLDGSYEQCPTTMSDYAQRDQRWCQGNLQHIKLLLAEGIHPASRLHLGMGVMSYLASPIWLLFLILTICQAGGKDASDLAGSSSGGAIVLFSVAMAMLLLPKLWSVLALVGEPTRVAQHGGWKKVLSSVTIETAISILTAPIMMLLHSHFVVATLTGRQVHWNSQDRGDHGVTFREAFRVHSFHTLIGLATVGLLTWFTPGLLPWMVPVLIGPILSIPLSMWLGSVGWGKRLRRAMLLSIPEERSEPEVLAAKRRHLSRLKLTNVPLFDAVLSDPAFYALHTGILRATASRLPVTPEFLNDALVAMEESGPRGLAPDTRRALLNDVHAMEELHVRVRSRWLHDRSVVIA